MRFRGSHWMGVAQQRGVWSGASNAAGPSSGQCRSDPIEKVTLGIHCMPDFAIGCIAMLCINRKPVTKDVFRLP